MKMKIKSWKVSQIIHDMSKFGDKYDINIEGQTFGVDFEKCVDAEGYCTVTNVYNVLKSTDKALYVNIDGFKTWIPKSASVLLD